MLLGALRRLDPAIVEVRGVSRTDAGVHARDQRVAFDLVSDAIPPKGWVYGLRPYLPPDLVVQRAAYVEAGFTPRFHCVDKTYRYTLHVSPTKDPFLRRRVWHLPELVGCADLVDTLRREAEALIGTHDFAAFRSAQDERTNTVRRIASVEVSAGEHATVRIDVTGDGFLHRMVRIIIGSLVDVTRNRAEPGVVARGLATRERTSLGQTAPPNGLCLWRVRLDEDGDEAFP